MLLELNIKNFAIIEDINVKFEQGLNVLTGETGSGKSIIIEALSLVLGGRANKDIIKNGKDFAYIEAVFMDDLRKTEDLLRENGVESDGLIIISREISKNRPSISKINGRTVTNSLLSKVTLKLIDIFAQHESIALMNSNNQKDLIDSFGSENHRKNLEKLRRKVEKLHSLEKEYVEISLSEKDKDREIDLLKYQINEIEDAALTEEDNDEVEQEFKKLSNISEITNELRAAIDILRSNYESFNVEDSLDTVISFVAKSLSYDNDLNNIYSELENIRYSLGDVVVNLNSYLEGIDYSEEKLVYFENRVNTVNTLKKKYGNTISEINLYLEAIKDRLDFLINFEEKVKNLKKEINLIREDSIKIAELISLDRGKIAEYLCENVKNELIELNIENAKFKVNITKKELSKDGFDNIEFMISTNLGEDFKTLSRTASGGEMSRIMLGFKSIIAEKENISTLVFDEIDTGISGRTAQIVGNKIKKLSRNRQIIAISHLPQIVSLADAHYLIEKEEKNKSTSSNIYKLGNKERVLELARLIGGYDITETAIKAAEEMIRFNK